MTFQAQRRSNESRTATELDLKGPPEHTPKPDKNTKRAFNHHAVGTLVEVKIRVLHRGHHAARTGEGVEEKVVG